MKEDSAVYRTKKLGLAIIAQMIRDVLDFKLTKTMTKGDFKELKRNYEVAKYDLYQRKDLELFLNVFGIDMNADCIRRQVRQLEKDSKRIKKFFDKEEIWQEKKSHYMTKRESY